MVLSRGWCTNCQSLTEQQKNTTPQVGLGFCANLAQIFLYLCVCFFAGFHLPERQHFSPILGTIFALILVCWILRSFFMQILHNFLCADFYTDFWCTMPDYCAYLLRRFSALALKKKGVPESRKNLHKICGKICGIPTASLQRDPYSISAALSRQHVTQYPPTPSTQGEHVSVHYGTLGPKACSRLLQDISR